MEGILVCNSFSVIKYQYI